MTSAEPLPGVFNTAEPALAVGPGGTVTLVEGSTFCLSDSTGDIRPGAAHGLFFRDARLISRWELQLDGQSPHPLLVLATEAFWARFVSRRLPAAEASSTLLLVRERLIGDGMRETVRVRNLSREASTVSLVLRVEADFPDLFAVKDGLDTHAGSDAAVTDTEMVMRAQSATGRGLSITATGNPLIRPGTLSWEIVIPPRQDWETEILVQPLVDDRRVVPQFSPGQRPQDSGPARRIQAWRRASTVITTPNPAISQVLRRTETDLGALQVHDPAHGDPFVAAGAPWFMTLFGRDSLLSAWMALPLDGSLALGTLRTLARVQGRQADPLTEEEPGRILHEVRRGPGSFPLSGASHYYGTIDATPLFVMLLGECWRWGADEAVIRELLPAADAAVSWMASYGDRDGDGFAEYQRATDQGLANQGWKDSFDGVNDAAGRLPATPIALCEVQGYVYAALLARAALADDFGEPAVAEQCRSRAASLKENFAEAFWLPDRGWYAVALDGAKQQVDGLTSNIAHCLWTGIATDEHASAVIEKLASPEMNTGFGLRTLASSMGAYNPMSYHNGSVWPHDTAIAVAGLLRYAHLDGAVALAEQLANGLLDAAASFGGRLPELFCGFPRSEFSPPVPHPTSCSPQAWASAAPLLLVRAFLGLEPNCPHRSLTIRPAIPAAWGTITLSGLRLGNTTVSISASGTTGTVEGLPGNWASTAPIPQPPASR